MFNNFKKKETTPDTFLTAAVTIKTALSATVLATAVLMSAPSLSAQLHEQISVEGKYVPEIIRGERINVLPKAIRYNIEESPLDYDDGGVAASFAPVLYTMPATGWRSSRAIDTYPGYVEFGLGSWLDATLSAGYRFIDNKTTLLGLRFQHNSTSLWKPRMSEQTANVKQYRYDEAVGVYFARNLSAKGRLDASLDYNLGAFNYYGVFTDIIPNEQQFKAPTQTLNDVALRLGWHSAIRPGNTSGYSVNADLRFSGYRALWLPETALESRVDGLKETQIELTGKVYFPWGDGSRAGIDASLDVLAYGGISEPLIFLFSDAGAPYSIDKPDNYGLLSLKPFYRFTKGLLDINAGIDIDLSFNAGEKGDRYSFFHIAPDIRFALRKNAFGIFLNITGGSELNTLAFLRNLDYYSMPMLTSTRPSYSPFDLTFGVEFGPFSGFSIGMDAAYKVSRNIPLGGWYMAMLNYGDAMMPGMSIPLSGNENILYSLDKEGINLHGGKLGAHILYEPSACFKINGKIDWQPQKNKLGYFDGYDRPKVKASISASVSPIDPLCLSLGYDFRGGRKIYTRELLGFWNNGVSIDDSYEPELVSLPLPDLSLLNFAASWDFSQAFSIWLQADNLLNRHTEILPCQPMQGIVVTAGLKFLF